MNLLGGGARGGGVVGLVVFISYMCRVYGWLGRGRCGAGLPWCRLPWASLGLNSGRLDNHVSVTPAVLPGCCRVGEGRGAHAVKRAQVCAGGACQPHSLRSRDTSTPLTPFARCAITTPASLSPKVSGAPLPGSSQTFSLTAFSIILNPLPHTHPPARLFAGLPRPPVPKRVTNRSHLSR
jgi:hypothetical protein